MSLFVASDLSDPTAYYTDFWNYAAYYGETAARAYYTTWSPPEGTPPPPGVVLPAENKVAPAPAESGDASAAQPVSEIIDNFNIYDKPLRLAFIVIAQVYDEAAIAAYNEQVLLFIYPKFNCCSSPVLSSMRSGIVNKVFCSKEEMAVNPLNTKGPLLLHPRYKSRHTASMQSR